jgi:hypothetical protein
LNFITQDDYDYDKRSLSGVFTSLRVRRHHQLGEAQQQLELIPVPVAGAALGKSLPQEVGMLEPL